MPGTAEEKEDVTVLGSTNYRGQTRPFGILPDDRRRHLYVIGKTGVGKSTLLENMIAQDIVNGKGVCFVDPHGDAAENLLNAIPPHRINDVVYFDPSDVDYPVAFNVLEAKDPAYKYLIASGLVSSLKKIWADSWGPRLEYILRNTILALLDYPGSTILGILRMLADKSYRKKVVERIEDPVVKAFWVNEFAQYNERFRSEAISPIQNKVGQLLSSAIIRNIMAQSKSTIDMHDIMENGKILLINVSKGKIGEDNSALLGAMIINRLQLAAMDRANMPEEERRDFYLYVDEFQNFATESFADILSEARKYRLNLTMAHQYVAQMEEPVRDAVFGNVGTIVSFRVGAADAEYLEKEFAPTFTETDLVNLDKFSAYCKLMINGISSRPFSMRTLAPALENFDKGEIVREVSRERYGRKREIIEEKIQRWSGVALSEKGEAENVQAAARPQQGRRDGRGTETVRNRQSRDSRQPRPSAQAAARPPANQRTERPVSNSSSPPAKRELVDVVLASQDNKITDLAAALRQETTKEQEKREQKTKEKKLWPAICSRCDDATEVPFEPDPNKPVYCRECLAIVKNEEKQAQTHEKEPAAALTTTEPQVRPPVKERKRSAFGGPPPPSLPPQ